MRRRNAIFTLAISCIIAGCVSIGPPGAPITLTAEQIHAVQDGLKLRLKDPGSAIFPGNTAAAQAANGDITACGLVNAKNSFGGYTGASLYITTMRNGVVIDAAIEDSQYNIIAGFCRQRGVAI